MGRPGPSAAPVARGVHCELATPGDDADLRRLLRDTSMDGWVRLAFPRDPSSSAASDVEGMRHATVVVRRHGDGAVVAMGSRSVREVWLDGRPALVGYLGRLRFAPGWRAGRRTLVRGYAMARSLRRNDEAPFDLTSVVADNARARRLLERGLPGMPRYTRLTELVTRVVPTVRGWGGSRRDGSGSGVKVRAPAGLDLGDRVRSRVRGGRMEVRDANGRDLLDAMAPLLERVGTTVRLAPRWTRERLEELAGGRLGPWRPLVAVRGDEPVGCGAVWDQRALRPCVVAGYAPWLGCLRRVVNTGRWLMGRPPLPPPGTALPMAYLSHLAADDGETLEALVSAARSRAAAGGIEHLAFALPPGPSLPDRFVRRLGGHTYRSVLYAVHDAGLDGLGVLPRNGETRVEVATL